MATFKASEVDNYGGNGSHGYFSLADDGDTARVRFMYDSIEDVQGLAVHDIKIGDQHRFVNCLRSYDEPISKCPLCRERYYQLAKLYIPVYDVDSKEVLIWERGKKFFSKISSLCAHYPHLVSHIFEIERHGKKGDTNTTYEIYEEGQDNTTLEDLPELPTIIGGPVLDKSAEELDYFLDYGEFEEPNSVEDSPRRRERTDDYPRRDERRGSNRDEDSRNEYRGRRRTPAGRGDRDREF